MGILQKLVCRKRGFFTKLKEYYSLMMVRTQSVYSRTIFALKERQCLISWRASLYLCLLLTGCPTFRPRKTSIILVLNLNSIDLQQIHSMSQSHIGSRADIRNEMHNYDKSEQSKRKRRTRNDEDGRTFTCSCGKSYLSYPALYTHIKTKHNGKAEYGKMGFKEDAHAGADSPQIKEEEDEIESIEKQQQQNSIEQLRNYLGVYFPAAQKDKQAEKKGKESRQQRLFIRNIKQYWQRHRKQEEIFQNDVYTTPIDYVLGRFFLEMEDNVSKSCFKFIIDFILNLRNALNQLKESEEFCKIESANGLPLLLNEVFMKKFQNMQEGHLYRRHPTIVCRSLYHFGKWLFQERFTNLLIKFNHL